MMNHVLVLLDTKAPRFLVSSNQDDEILLSCSISTVEDNRKTLVGEDKTFAEQEQSRRIAFSRLFSLSNDRNFSVAHEFVDVIYTPHKNLEETYIDIVAAWVQENVREIDLEGSVTIHSNEMDEDEKNRLDSTIENSLFNTQPEYEV